MATHGPDNPDGPGESEKPGGKGKKRQPSSRGRAMQPASTGDAASSGAGTGEGARTTPHITPFRVAPTDPPVQHGPDATLAEWAYGERGRWSIGCYFLHPSQPDALVMCFRTAQFDVQARVVFAVISMEEPPRYMTADELLARYGGPGFRPTQVWKIAQEQSGAYGDG